MFSSLANRPWHVFCRVHLQHKAPLAHRSPRCPQLCNGEDSRNFRAIALELFCWFTMMCERRNNYLTFCCTGWQAGGFHSWCISLPECRVASRGLGKVQYYSTSGNDKDGPSKPSSDAPTAEQVLSAATPASSGDQFVINVCVFFACCVKLCCLY